MEYSITSCQIHPRLAGLRSPFLPAIRSSTRPPALGRRVVSTATVGVPADIQLLQFSCGRQESDTGGCITTMEKTFLCKLRLKHPSCTCNRHLEMNQTVLVLQRIVLFYPQPFVPPPISNSLVSQTPLALPSLSISTLPNQPRKPPVRFSSLELLDSPRLGPSSCSADLQKHTGLEMEI
jgi:hypothetical protein